MLQASSISADVGVVRGDRGRERAARPSSVLGLDQVVFFHGTNTEAKARSILEHGLLPDMPSVYVRGPQPMPGRVYFGKRVSVAVSYAMRPSSGRWSEIDRDRAAHPFGYVFVVAGDPLVDRLWPDEDDVGNFITFHAAEVGRLDGSTHVDGKCVTVRKYAFKPIAREADIDRKRLAWKAMHKFLTPEIMTRLSFDCDVLQVGKHLLGKMPATTRALFAEWSEDAVSFDGPVRPLSCWRFRKDMAKSLRGGQAEFFSIAEPFR